MGQRKGGRKRGVGGGGGERKGEKTGNLNISENKMTGVI